ncbi:MAG: adenosine kinase [Ilumatobacteraceae bacterium]|nr:adenosine kinase [Ilumatobacteraceae bacterium]
MQGLKNSQDIRYHVVGIGNALVDVIARVDESFLIDHNLSKGAMALIDTDQAIALYESIGPATQTSGGSAANTIVGISSFGGNVAFVGKVAKDAVGDIFSRDMQEIGVQFHSGAADETLPTGRCIIAVTPDAQRTMNTFLGISTMLNIDDVDAEVIESAAVLYMEGYLFDRDEAKQAFRRAAVMAHQHGRVVSLTLSDAFCVDRHRDDFRSLVADEIDVLFANEAELLSLYQVDSFEQAIGQLRQECQVAVITRSEKGAVIVTRDHEYVVDAIAVPDVVDTTGAGDLFAAGFLYGYTSGYALETCGRIGAIAAAEVISHVGPRPLVPLRSLLPADLQ